MLIDDWKERPEKVKFLKPIRNYGKGTGK